ncbi:hypothetical protein H0184_18150 [Neobacillus niacini]|nr:hypothetical protein [Neobacillus niacini]
MADTMAIPKGVPHKYQAEMLVPEGSVKNYESIGCSNLNEKAYPLH